MFKYLQITCGTWPKIKAYIHRRSSNRSRQVQLNTASNGILSPRSKVLSFMRFSNFLIYYLQSTLVLWCLSLFLCLSFEYFTLQNFWFSCHSIHLIFSLNLSSEPILCCFFCAFHKVSYMYMWVRHDLNLLTCAVCTYIYRLLWMRVELSEENKNGVKWIAIRFHVHWRFLLNEWNSPYLSLSFIMWLWQRQRQCVH